MKHMKAPWSIRGIAEKRIIYKATDTTTYPIAIVQLDNLSRFGSGDLDATAHLVAAAPTMFTALEIISMPLKNAGQDLTREQLINLLADYGAEAAKAIAKARGES